MASHHVTVYLDTSIESVNLDPRTPMWVLSASHGDHMLCRRGRKIPVRALTTPVCKIGAEFECIPWTPKYEWVRARIEELRTQNESN